MSTMNEHLDTMTVRAATPDGTAFATLQGRGAVSVSFAPGYYASSNESRLELKLGQLGRLLWVARMKEYYRFKSEQLGREIRGEGRPRTARQEARREARDQIAATGSGGGIVTLTAVGMLSWTAEIAPGTVARTDESVFCAAVAQAAESLITDHMGKLRRTWSDPAFAAASRT